METTLAQQPDVPAEPPESADAAWLPITAGDSFIARARPREHEWPADLYILLASLSGVGLALGAVGMTVAMVTFVGLLSVWMIPTVLAMAVGSVVQFALARHLKHFSRWGWYGAMAELAFLTLSKVSAIATDPDALVFSGIGIVIDLLWMRYFWNRRADFDVDLAF